MTGLTKEQWPTCAVCRAPVAEMVSYYDPKTRQTFYEAHCHGSVECQAMPDDVLNNYRAGELRGGFAFVSEVPRLT